MATARLTRAHAADVRSFKFKVSAIARRARNGPAGAGTQQHAEAPAA